MVKNSSILSWIRWSNFCFFWSHARNVWYRFICSYLSWIIRISCVSWIWYVWNWITRWINWNDLTNLVIYNFDSDIWIIHSYLLTLNICTTVFIHSDISLICNVTTDYRNINVVISVAFLSWLAILNCEAVVILSIRLMIFKLIALVINEFNCLTSLNIYCLSKMIIYSSTWMLGIKRSLRNDGRISKPYMIIL